MNVELQNRIIESIRDRRINFGGSDAKFALTLGISGSQYSRIMKGDTDRVLSDANWISIARKLEVTLGDMPVWNVARTPVYEYITTQFTINDGLVNDVKNYFQGGEYNFDNFMGRLKEALMLVLNDTVNTI